MPGRFAFTGRLAALLSGLFAASLWFPDGYHEEKATSPVESLPYIAAQVTLIAS
jgi:hypothetical protein